MADTGESGTPKEPHRGWIVGHSETMVSVAPLRPGLGDKGLSSLAFIGNAAAHDDWGEDANFEPRRFG